MLEIFPGTFKIKQLGKMEPFTKERRGRKNEENLLVTGFQLLV
jgi:hypothetical protein